MSNEVVLGYRLPNENSSVTTDTCNIVYRQITMVKDNHHPKYDSYFDVVYVNSGDEPWCDDIEYFIDYIVENEDEGPFPIRLASPLDLNCKEDSYIVFHLDPTVNWQFSTSGDCFLTKDDEAYKYYQLHHVTSDGVRIPGGEEIDPGCRILYFRARCKNYKFNDGFNLVIELLLDDVDGEKRRTKIVIDPDIRNPGGSGGGNLMKAGRRSRQELSSQSLDDAGKNSAKRVRKNPGKRATK